LPALENDLRRLQAPVRLVWGTGDPYFPVTTAEWLDRILGNSRGVRRVDGAKLYFPEEMPDIIVAEALALWGGTNANSAGQGPLIKASAQTPE
jgi:pimeloyl-ACP methyl ester carboxylesterase